MNTEQFAYWLQGYSEITGGRVPNETEWLVIQDHLKLVFAKKTPDRIVPSILPSTMTDPYKGLQDALKFPNPVMTTC